MTTFTIDNESNKILPADSEYAAEIASGAQRFSSQTEWASLAEEWPMTRLIAIWNQLPEVNPVTKFKDRKTAIMRIWSALNAQGISTPLTAESGTEFIPASEIAQQPTFAPEASQGPGVAPVDRPAKQKATRKKKTPTPPTTAKGSKTAAVLELMKRDGGVTAKELMAVTGWQAHSVRGFISGTLGKKMGLAVLSTKNESGERTYRVP